MIIQIEQSSTEPLYLQIRSQIIAAIARDELAPGAQLPSVRILARDLGINLHTVNKAYAVLRDEGYLVMRGRSGATIADPTDARIATKGEAAASKMDEDLFALALAHRARGGTVEEFTIHASQQALKAFAKATDLSEYEDQSDQMYSKTDAEKTGLKEPLSRIKPGTTNKEEDRL